MPPTSPSRFRVRAVLRTGAGSLFLAATLAAQDAAPRPQAREASPSRGPNVLLISVDALRRDHMGAYGYPRATTPRIDALLARSVTFDNAFAPIARSLPGHVSIWTTSWPHRHGVIAHGGVKNIFASTPERRSAAELLRDAGYRTTAFVGSHILGPAGGLNAGFEFVDAPPRADMGAREIVRTSAEIAERASKWLGFQRKTPFVLWTHFAGPGEPNHPPPKLVELFRGDGHAAKLIERRGLDPERFQLGFPKLLLIRMFFPELEGTVTPTEDLPLPRLDQARFENLIDRYDADLRSVDDAVGALLDRLDELELAQSTLVLFVGAYGQALGDRKLLGSGEISLENVVVPMAISFPSSVGVEPRRLAGLASTIDLLPTALARTHPDVAAKLAGQGDGLDLLAEGAARDYVLSQRTRRENARHDPGPMYAWRSAEWTYVRRPDLTDYLFERRGDPNELVNLSFQRPEQAAECKARALEAFGLKDAPLKPR